MKILLTIVILLFSSIAQAQNDHYPSIKEGLWQLSTATEKGKTQLVKYCMGDNASLKDMIDSSRQMMQDMCDEPKTVKSGNTFTTSHTCNFGISKLSIKSVAKGDFEKEYEVVTKAVFNPPIAGNKGSNTKTKAKHQGACAKGMIPGDIEMSDGKKFNLNDFNKKVKKQMKKLNSKKLESLDKKIQSKTK